MTKKHSPIYPVRNISDEQSDFLQAMNSWQLEGRYPDYISLLTKSLKSKEAVQILESVKLLVQCLQEKLP